MNASTSSDLFIYVGETIPCTSLFSARYHDFAGYKQSRGEYQEWLEERDLDQNET